MTRITRVLVVSLILAATGVAGIGLTYSVSRTPPKRAFYYWKTQWKPSPAVLESIEKNGIQQLYVRFFDVKWDDAEQSTTPVSPIRFDAPVPRGVEIVPVVYIVNNVFLRIPYAETGALADKVFRKVSQMADAQGFQFQELQIDCDWTDSTQRNYFHFAEVLGRKLRGQKKGISATIRLHQVKYAGRTGTPPVDHGMLMFYNFGRIEAGSSRSSIFNSEDAARYSDYISRYSMKLDVVLPVFSWSIHSRDGNVLGLLEGIDEAELDSFEGFHKLAANRYSARRSFFLRGRYFREGDLVVVDRVTPEVTKQAAALAKEGAGWRKNYGTVALFDLDERSLRDYSAADIGGILDRF